MLSNHDEDNNFNVEQRIAAKELFFRSIQDFFSEELTWDAETLGDINAEDLTKLNNHIQKNSSIKMLDLSCNRLGQSKELMVLLVKLLENNPQINSLNLFLNFINTDSLDILFQSKELCKRLKNMDINFMSNMIDDNGFKKAINYLSLDSLDSMLRGNIMKDIDFIEKYRASIVQQAAVNSMPSTSDSSVKTSQSGIFSSSNKNHANSPASAGKYILGESSSAREDEHKEQTPPRSPKSKEECKEHTPPKKNSI